MLAKAVLPVFFFSALIYSLPTVQEGKKSFNSLCAQLDIHAGNFSKPTPREADSYLLYISQQFDVSAVFLLHTIYIQMTCAWKYNQGYKF